MSRVLIFGVTGMDGSHLADLLVARGDEVHGMVRPSSTGNTKNIDHLTGKITLHRGDLTDPRSVEQCLRIVRPDVVYNEADQDSVSWSHSLPGVAAAITYGAVVNLFEAVLAVVPNARVFQPCSATMFLGDDPGGFLNEGSQITPMSPYAVAKSAAYHAARFYRRCHGLRVSTGILFPHTSERQRADYLLPRLVKAALKTPSVLEVDDPNQVVDVGYAPDYMDAIARVTDLPEPDDYVVGTGFGLKLWQLFDLCCGSAGHGKYSVKITPSFRKSPVQTWVADTTKLYAATGWRPGVTGYVLTDKMVTHYRSKS